MIFWCCFLGVGGWEIFCQPSGVIIPVIIRMEKMVVFQGSRIMSAMHSLSGQDWWVSVNAWWGWWGLELNYTEYIVMVTVTPPKTNMTLEDP